MSKRPRTSTPVSYPGGLSRAQVVAWRNAIFVIFGLAGLDLASWVARVPTVRDALHATTLQMGSLIFGLALGSIVGLLVSSHVIARLGAAKAIAWCLTIGPLGLAIAGIGATIAPNFAMTFIGLAIFGAGAGLCDVAMNVSGAASERILQRSIMALYHAFFSFGTMIGAGLGALADLVNLPLAIHTGIIVVITIVTALVATRFLHPEDASQSESRPVEISPSAPPTAADQQKAETWRSRLRVWGESRTLLIGVIVLGMAFAEGSANDWLALAMVDGHGVSNTTGALIFGVFVTSMTVGRVAGGTLLDRFGRVSVLRASAALAATGLLMVIFIPNTGVAVFGTVLWGLGSALGFPVGMSAAADDPKKAAARVSAVATIGYCSFLVGPPIIGFLGEHVGLLNGLLLVLVLIAAAGAASGAARSTTSERPR
jgi:MFS family permease